MTTRYAHDQGINDVSAKDILGEIAKRDASVLGDGDTDETSARGSTTRPDTA